MPLQMVGTRRSGSNLLRVMIGQLDGVYAPQSTHMLEYFFPLVAHYGDLNADATFLSLVNDVCKCVELNPVKWDGVKLDRAEIFTQCKTRSLLAIFEAIYAMAAKQLGCNKVWMCKCLGYINYFDEFEEYFSKDMRYIYIYRDGRDVALSFTKAFAGQKHYYFIAQEWFKTQRLALKLKLRLPPSRFYSVRYESLIKDPEQTCKGIAEFIGQPYTDAMLKFYLSKAARNSASSSNLWGNIGRPIISDNSMKFFSQSTMEEIQIFESVAGKMLEALGYECYFTGREKEFTDRLIKQYEKENAQRKKQIIQQANPEDINRREKQKQHVDNIKQRLGCTEVQYDGNMLHKSSAVN
ncbi:sulfotransferase [Beggiatoa alba]|nr:sulfotransferase [Beggiatoa alba]